MVPTGQEAGHAYLRGLDRVALCSLPTPLVEAPRLTEELRGPRIFVKRDDLTGLALGGNKSRACEFVLGRARAAGHDVVIAVGPQHSNQLCAITAAAKKCGMRVILLLLKGDDRVQGNLLLFHMMGADVRLTGVDISDIGEAYELMGALAARLRGEGARPYELRYGPLPLEGMAGYVLLMGEILDRLGERSSGATHIFVGSGSGLTQAGLILGDRLLRGAPPGAAPPNVQPPGATRPGGGCRIHGVMLDERFGQEQQEEGVLAAVAAGAALLAGGPPAAAGSAALAGAAPVEAGDVRCIPGYNRTDGATQRKADEAIRLVARTEGLFLDPVYTGRVMAALIDHIRAGLMPRDDTVVFYHSGGIPAVFSHCDAEAFLPGVRHVPST